LTWLAWRQFRTQLVVAVIFLALLAAYVLSTGPHIAHVFALTARNCHSTCNPVNTNDSKLTQYLPEMNNLMQLIPALIGMFWGAPLVAREIDSGSIRLFLTQSVSRTRWLSSKLLIIALATVIVAGLSSLMITWWAGPWDHYNNLPFGTFNVRNVVPVAYSIFSFALGAFVGLVLRRTIPAMAVTLVLFGSVLGAFGQWIRPHLPGFNVPSRYWTLQWTESFIYLGFAVILFFAAVWLLRRRTL
jgi:ABC-type transport system involved in multi-copper enzyme maturation permease subunit